MPCKKCTETIDATGSCCYNIKSKDYVDGHFALERVLSDPREA